MPDSPECTKGCVMMPPGSIPPMQRSKGASILVAQYLEEFWRNSWGNFLEKGKFLGEFFGGGEILGGSAGAPGGWRGEGLAMNMVHQLKPFPHTYIVH